MWLMGFKKNTFEMFMYRWLFIVCSLTIWKTEVKNLVFTSCIYALKRQGCCLCTRLFFTIVLSTESNEQKQGTCTVLKCHLNEQVQVWKSGHELMNTFFFLHGTVDQCKSNMHQLDLSVCQLQNRKCLTPEISPCFSCCFFVYGSLKPILVWL